MGNIFLARAITLMLPLAVLLSAGCTKEQQEELKPTVDLNLEYPAIAFSVDSGGAAGQLSITLSFDGNALGQLLADNNYSLDQLKEFRFTKADLHLTTPAGSNYDMLGSIALQLALANGQPVTVANLDPIPHGTQTIVMHLGDVNVADIIRDSNVQLTAKVQLDGPMPTASEHTLDLGAKVVVQL
ncbi:MAG TPA: hypothetical protein PLY76_13845 [Flavobacteriales bacterium]|nr:hypothetical protein [Flavobacteriales bacterium]HRP82974.1 hypothetical protein [Flavobacteriales bacterium]